MLRWHPGPPTSAQAATFTLPGYASFSLKEKLQAFLESLLSEYLQEREFVAIAMKSLVDAPLQSIGAMQPLKARFTAFVDRVLDDAVAGRGRKPFEQQRLGSC